MATPLLTTRVNATSFSCAQLPTRIARKAATQGKGKQLALQERAKLGRLEPPKALDASICLSVAQEEVAFAALLAAETYLSAKKKKELTGEDTNLFHPSIVVGVIVVSSGLVSSRNELLGKVGLLFTSIAAFAVIGKYAKRFLEAEVGTTEEFPGPKALPAFCIFASLMAFLASTQALTKV